MRGSLLLAASSLHGVEGTDSIEGAAAAISAHLGVVVGVVFAVGLPGLKFLAVLPSSGRQTVTIDATRYRTGTVSRQEATSEHPVSFTVFIVCAPAYLTCHLLRLSQLDNPLR